MKIAAIVNEEGQVVNSYVKSQLYVYEQGPGGWLLKKQIFVDVRETMGLAEVKSYLEYIFRQLEGCEIVLLRELRGLLYVLLQEMRFRIWKSEGDIVEQMDQVARRETETRQAVAKPIPAPQLVGRPTDGCYRINLAEVMKNNPSLNSRQILIPFLEQGGFQELEIICDHIPRWVSQECARLDLHAEPGEVQASAPGMKAVILSPAMKTSEP
jgi:Fe-only nitrogenase accessory protein AnfO